MATAHPLGSAMKRRFPPPVRFHDGQHHYLLANGERLTQSVYRKTEIGLSTGTSLAAKRRLETSIPTSGSFQNRENRLLLMNVERSMKIISIKQI
jgi:hypothetical protein